ncbi:four helix bundle protein [Candidatus Peregrinibacteria bacterium RIFOXYB2_FULL_32_7]|nr:MAG: four helix bundle protein [Candidatus Peregrinibacteria bacterium RIFOXYB2_FULL_32_7]
MEKNNLIQTKSFEFALNIIKLYQNLQNNKEFVISKQLLRSATNIGANIEEALGAVSKKDFQNKMSISCKEARESKYWLRLLENSKLVDLNYSSYLTDVTSIINILTKIIKTSSSNNNL